MDVLDFEAKARSLLNNGYGDGEVKVLTQALKLMYETGLYDGRMQERLDQYYILHGDPTASKPQGVINVKGGGR